MEVRWGMIIMSTILDGVQDATSIRRWARFISSVARKEARPVVIKGDQDFLAAMSLDVLNQLLEQYKLTLEYETEDDGTVSGSLNEIDLVANAPNVEELRLELAKALVEYATDYWNEFARYSRAPNRKAHLPFVLRVLTQPDLERVSNLINA